MIQDISFPYLRHMIAYSRLVGRVWGLRCHQANPRQSGSQKDAGFLDYQIQTWSSSVQAWAEGSASENKFKASHILLQLRRNQALLVLKQVSKATTSSRPVRDDLLIAQETIQLLRNLHAEGTVYKSQQVSFHLFLVSALGTIFSAVMEDPIFHGPVCRPSFYTGLDLISCCSPKLSASPRLAALVDRVWVVYRQRQFFASDHSLPALQDARLITRFLSTVFEDLVCPSPTAHSPDVLDCCVLPTFET